MPFLLQSTVDRLAELLIEHDRQIVFAESCTGGLVSAALAQVPGISQRHCGSAVVYQIETKAAWLDVPESELLDPGPVSRLVAKKMALGVLHHTPRANLAASVTGHLGPDAPPDQDGLVFIAVAESQGDDAVIVTERREQIGFQGEPRVVRVERQFAAAELVLRSVIEFLQDASTTLPG